MTRAQQSLGRGKPFSRRRVAYIRMGSAEHHHLLRRAVATKSPELWAPPSELPRAGRATGTAAHAGQNERRHSSCPAPLRPAGSGNEAARPVQRAEPAAPRLQLNGERCGHRDVCRGAAGRALPRPKPQRAGRDRMAPGHLRASMPNLRAQGLLHRPGTQRALTGPTHGGQR